MHSWKWFYGSGNRLDRHQLRRGLCPRPFLPVYRPGGHLAATGWVLTWLRRGRGTLERKLGCSSDSAWLALPGLADKVKNPAPGVRPSARGARESEAAAGVGRGVGGGGPKAGGDLSAEQQRLLPAQPRTRLVFSLLLRSLIFFTKGLVTCTAQNSERTSQCLEQCPAHGWHSKSTYWINSL